MKFTLCACLLAFSGCVSNAWDQYPGSLYNVLRADTPTAIGNHQHLLQRLVSSAEDAGRRPHPGICAEFAYYSWRIGKSDVALAALAKERAHYPQSEKFVAILEKFLPTVPVVEVPASRKTGGDNDY